MKGSKTRDHSNWLRLIPFLVLSLVMAFMTVTVFAEPDEGDPFENVQFFELEQITEGPRRVFDDGGLTFGLPDEALDVEGVTQYEGFVGIPGEDGWKELEGCYNYDDAAKQITVVGQAIGNRYPDGDAPGHIGVQIIGKNAAGENLMIAGFNDVEFRYSTEQFEFEDSRDVLPHWDGDFQDTINVYVENSAYPDGEDLKAEVTNVEVTEGEGLLEDFHEDSNEESRWWYYRAGDTLGDVTFKVSYNYNGEPGTREMKLHIKDHVYHVDMWPVEGINQGLPGTSIELQTYAEHQYAYRDENNPNEWHHESTQDGLEYFWCFEKNGKFGAFSEFATITPNTEDPSKATLTFKDMPEGWDDIGEHINVAVGITDTKSGDPQRERASHQRDFWVNSDYMQIMPALIDSSLDVGKSVTIEPELRHYQYGKDGYVVIDNAEFEIEEYDPNAIEFDKTGGVFTITRKGDWDTNFNIKAYFSWGYGRDDDKDQWYHLDRKNYEIRFEYDDFEIYDDQTLTVKLNKEDIEGLTEELADPNNKDYEIRYTVGRWNNEQEDWDVELSSDTYEADKDGITISGKTIKDANLDGVNIRAELFINGEKFGGKNISRDTWCWLSLRDSCEKEHNWIKATIKKATCVEKGQDVWICLAHPNWEGCGEVRFVDTEDPDAHSLTKIAAKDSTLTATGNIEHYKCKLCSKLFSDAAGTMPIDAASVVIAKKINISGASVAAIPNKTYNKTAQKPALTVKYGGTALKAGTDYTVAYSANTNVGTAMATITGKGKYAGTKTVTFKIVKAANPIKLTAKKPTVKFAALSKKNQVIKQTAACAVSGAQGKVTWKKASGNAKITVAANGKITVKKGLKKGSYKIKVNATAAGNANYNKATKAATITIVVK